MSKNIESKMTRKLLNETRVESFMSSPVTVLRYDDLFSRVEEVFLNKQVRHLPIVDHCDKVIGIITQKDLYKIISPQQRIEKILEYDKDKIMDGKAYYSREVLDSYILKHVMTKNVCILGVKATAGEAIHSIVSNDISSVVIVNDDQMVVGIVTIFDIMNLANKIFMGEEQ